MPNLVVGTLYRSASGLGRYLRRYLSPSQARFLAGCALLLISAAHIVSRNRATLARPSKKDETARQVGQFIAIVGSLVALSLVILAARRGWLF